MRQSSLSPGLSLLMISVGRGNITVELFSRLMLVRALNDAGLDLFKISNLSATFVVLGVFENKFFLFLQNMLFF